MDKRQLDRTLREREKLQKQQASDTWTKKSLGRKALEIGGFLLALVAAAIGTTLAGQFFS